MQLNVGDANKAAVEIVKLMVIHGYYQVQAGSTKTTAEIVDEIGKDASALAKSLTAPDWSAEAKNY
jgi:hypothetical protein